ncbi:MAG TPA: TerB family tellurite resistance protein [Chitinophagaceae bacterium]|nr:TerB family tellurite resistance protein [Chitinophagaceae bacterium]
MEEHKTLLEGYSDREKGAYLGAIASIATADREASQEELEYIAALCDAAALSEPQKTSVVRAATELSGKELTQCLDILKNSELKYSLVTDLMAFAKADNNYSEEEQEDISEIAEYLGVNQHQFSLLNQFADKATEKEVPVEEDAQPGFLSSLGLKDKLHNAGISGSTLLRGLIGIAGPILLGRMLSGRGRSFPGGPGGSMFGGGGLGSVIGMLNGGRGMGSLGGLFGRTLGRGGHI